MQKVGGWLLLIRLKKRHMNKMSQKLKRDNIYNLHHVSAKSIGKVKKILRSLQLSSTVKRSLIHRIQYYATLGIFESLTELEITKNKNPKYDRILNNWGNENENKNIYNKYLQNYQMIISHPLMFALISNQCESV